MKQQMQLLSQANRPARRPPRRRARISLTPLIDVVFILLVFFMLASNFTQWRQIEIDVPQRAGQGAGAKGSVFLEVTPDGLRLSGQVISDEELSRQLSRLARVRPTQKILIKPAKGVPLQRAVIILELVDQAGIQNVSFFHTGKQ
ncbi:MAG: biopolymer transporter ExbD [Pseudomonadota bacterium]